MIIFQLNYYLLNNCLLFIFYYMKKMDHFNKQDIINETKEEGKEIGSKKEENKEGLMKRIYSKIPSIMSWGVSGILILKVFI